MLCSSLNQKVTAIYIYNLARFPSLAIDAIVRHSSLIWLLERKRSDLSRLFASSGCWRPSRVQVDGVDLIEAAVDASRLEEEAVVGAGGHGVTAARLALQVLQQVEP